MIAGSRGHYTFCDLHAMTGHNTHLPTNLVYFHLQLYMHYPFEIQEKLFCAYIKQDGNTSARQLILCNMLISATTLTR